MPKRTVVAEASKATSRPAAAGLAVSAVTGAWSGVTATPRAAPVTGIAAPAVPAFASIGVTEPPPLAT